MLCYTDGSGGMQVGLLRRTLIPWFNRMDEKLAEQLRGLTLEKLRVLCSSRHTKVHSKNKEEPVEALSQIEDLNLEAIILTAATGHGAGNVEELVGQLMKMTLEMQREQRH